MVYVWITILGMLISAIVSVILSDKIIFGIDRLFIRLGISKSSNITGLWKATFVMGYGKDKMEYIEIISLKKIWNYLWSYC